MSFLIYDGPSLLDGKPIIVVMTGVIHPSHNRKTGAMAQTYIMRSDINPVEAVNDQLDGSVCGDCIHRGTSCYENVGHAPNMVYKAYKRGLYTAISPGEAALNRSVRVGSYGDPHAAANIWDELFKASKMHTGYTHQANKSNHLRGFVQASADSAEEALTYQSLGWKTFRVKNVDEPLLPEEIMCPYNILKGVQCINCGLCNGAQANVAVNVHGTKAKINKYKKWRLHNE